MRTVRGMKAAFKPFYQREPTEYPAQVTVDAKDRILIIELPGEGVVALPVDELRKWLNEVEERNHGQ